MTQYPSQPIQIRLQFVVDPHLTTPFQNNDGVIGISMHLLTQSN